MFRVEKQDGTGPYGNDADSMNLKQMNAQHGDADHLDPFDDPMLDGIYPDENCGFPTLCALEEWFNGYMDALAECGYRIAVYTVPLASVRYGHKQAVFLKEGAQPVRTFSMD